MKVFLQKGDSLSCKNESHPNIVLFAEWDNFANIERYSYVYHQTTFEMNSNTDSKLFGNVSRNTFIDVHLINHNQLNLIPSKRSRKNQEKRLSTHQTDLSKQHPLAGSPFISITRRWINYMPDVFLVRLRPSLVTPHAKPNHQASDPSSSTTQIVWNRNVLCFSVFVEPINLGLSLNHCISKWWWCGVHHVEVVWFSTLNQPTNRIYMQTPPLLPTAWLPFLRSHLPSLA